MRVFCGLLIALPSTIVAADDIGDAVAKAKVVYQAEVKSATQALLSSFQTAVKATAASGNLDAVKKIIAEKEAFEKSGQLPLSDAMKPHLAVYQTALKTANAKMSAAYDKGISDYTKALKIDSATKLQAEKKQFASGETPGVVPAAQQDGVAGAKTQFQNDLKAARTTLETAIDERVKELAATGNLALVKSVQALKDDPDGSTTVRDEAAKKAAMIYKKALDSARAKLNLAYNKAIAEAKTRKDYNLARKLTVEQDGEIGRDGKPRWTVIFHGRSPKIWNTDTNSASGYSVAAASIPGEVKYLRLRRMDQRKFVIVPMTKDRLTKMGLHTKWGWCGTAKEGWGGRHLGVYSANFVKGPAPKKMKGGISVGLEGNNAYFGYGFGHIIWTDNAQGFSWAGRRIRTVTFEIAVTSKPLTRAESRWLLK